MKYVGGTQEGLDLAHKLVQLGGTVKVTWIEKGPWNDMEGQNYTVRVKATAPKDRLWSTNGCKHMLYEFTTNSTWLDDEEWGDMSEEEIIKEMIYNVVA